MDDSDESLQIYPDGNGKLDLTNRAWTSLSPLIWSFHASLVILDVSCNNLDELPVEVGDMTFLKELQISFNKLARLPASIGKLKRLRRLILNNNRLEYFPDEVGRLDQLEVLVASENCLTFLPTTVKFMSSLTTLKLQNNNLLALPSELADVVTLKVVNVSNNENLTMIPESGRSDGSVILFIMKIHKDYLFRMEEVSRSNDELSKHSQHLEHDVLLLKEHISSLTARKDGKDSGSEFGTAEYGTTDTYRKSTGHRMKNFFRQLLRRTKRVVHE